jgi:hypothetical protein
MKKLLPLFVTILIIFGLYSCYDNPTDNPVPNKPPETGLFLMPDSGISPQPTKLKVSWWGDDPDGNVVGFYFTWDGINWTFTTSNDSLFSLQIGAADTTYLFQVSAVDNGGNGTYDNDIKRNGINFGPEPFIDKNSNGVYDKGEKYYDIGLIDPTPAKLNFPLINTAPTIGWNSLSTVPDTSFPVMSFGWNAQDLDGDQTILKIEIALNDTTDPSKIISLDGGTRNITIRTSDFQSSDPPMDILIEGLETNIFPEKLHGLKFNDDNCFFVKAVDISGASSPYISLPDSGKTWYVKKPKGKLLIVDDYALPDNSPQFYNSMMDSLGLSSNYDVLDRISNPLPYANVTFLQTMKLFKYVFWYSDNNPTLDLISAVSQKYLDAGGKIAYSIQFLQNISLDVISGFLPVNTDTVYTANSIVGGTIISADTTDPSYPELITTASLFRIKSFSLNPLGSIPVYYFPNHELSGFIGFFNNDTSLFFIGLPLSKCNGGAANVKNLLHKVLIEDFGVTP